MVEEGIAGEVVAEDMVTRPIVLVEGLSSVHITRSFSYHVLEEEGEVFID